MNILKKIKFKTYIPLLLAIMVFINGLLFIIPVVSRAIEHFSGMETTFHSWKSTLVFLKSFEIPQVMICFLLVFMSMLLPLRNRVAWFFTVALLFTVVVIDLFIIKEHNARTTYAVIVTAALLYNRQSFTYYSLAGGTFFAVVSISSLIVYGMLGTLYIGDQFEPPVHDLPTAFYFAIVCMSTVGFGDIVPHTTEARMFTLTVIISGITVFAASISSIAGPIISNNIKHIFKGRIYKVDRKNHYIVIGANSLALNVYNALIDRGDDVTVICPAGIQHPYPEHADIIEGDPASTSILTLAGAAKAKSIIALSDDDADNTFIILAAKEIAGESTTTMALVNDTENTSKMKRVNPDMIFSLPLLGSELLIRSLDGDVINNDFLNKMFFKDKA